MKWLFILFLIANIAFFSYSSFFSTNNPSMNTHKKSALDNQIQLLSEIDSTQLKKIKPDNKVLQLIKDGDTPVLKASPIDRSNNISSNQCFQLGPVNKDDMNEIRFILTNEYANNISFDIETTSPITYHRIYIPSQKNRSTIDKILKALDDNDLNDHYVMTIDGRKNAIALGVYKNKKTAKGIAVKVKYLGYSTIIEAITKDKNSLYNLQFEFTNNQSLSFFENFLLQNELKSSVCKNND